MRSVRRKPAPKSEGFASPSKDSENHNTKCITFTLAADAVDLEGQGLHRQSSIWRQPKMLILEHDPEGSRA